MKQIINYLGIFGIVVIPIALAILAFGIYFVSQNLFIY